MKQIDVPLDEDDIRMLRAALMSYIADHANDKVANATRISNARALDSLLRQHETILRG